MSHVLILSMCIAALLIGGCASRVAVKSYEPPPIVEMIPEPPPLFEKAQAPQMSVEPPRMAESARMAERASMDKNARRAESARMAEEMRRPSEQAKSSAPRTEPIPATVSTLAVQIEMIENTISEQRRTLGASEPSLAVYYDALATLQKRAGRFPAAEQNYLSALSLLKDAISKKLTAAQPTDCPFELDEKAYEKDESAREFVKVDPELKSKPTFESRTLPADPDIASSYKRAEAAVRNNLAILYRLWGRYQEADREYETAWNIVQQRFGSDSSKGSVARNNIGMLYDSMGRFNDAEVSYLNSLKILRKHTTSDKAALAAVTNNLAGLYLKTMQMKKAEPLLRESLELAEQLFGSSSAQTGLRHYNLGWLLLKVGKPNAADKELLKAMVIAAKEKDALLSWATRAAYAKLLEKKGKRRLAITFAKQAVNGIQGLKQNFGARNVEEMQRFQATAEGVYRYLASLLIADSRLSEAEYVIRLLKDREYASVAVRSGGRAADEWLALSTGEETAAASFETDINVLAYISLAMEKLEGERINGKMSPEAKKLFLKYRTSLASEEKKFQKSLVDIKKSRNSPVDIRKDFQTTFNEHFGPNSVMLQTVVAEDCLWVVLVTQDFRKAYKTPIKESVLNAKISGFREALSPGNSARLEIRPMAGELYGIIMKSRSEQGSVLEADLKKLKRPTIVWSLDGALRYLPVSALYDGSRYLAETYASVIFTPSSSTMRQLPLQQGDWRALAVGVTEGDNRFSSLPAVATELKSIVKSSDNATGVIDGKILLDKAFTQSSFMEALLDGYQIVHISSHFNFVPGDKKLTGLLLGDRNLLSIENIGETNDLFKGVGLLTLSACETAVGDQGSKDGREVEGLGVLAQELGARSVLATLWQVSDDGTSSFMHEFYRQRVSAGKSGGSALREAQVALLHGTSNPDSIPGISREGVERSTVRLAKETPASTKGAQQYVSDPQRPYAHPYFWAPFIMYGVQ